MVYFLIIYMVIVVNFMISSTLMGKKIWNYMRPNVKKEESLMVIQKDNATNSILDVLEVGLDKVNNVRNDAIDKVSNVKDVVTNITTRRTRKKTN